MHAICLVLWWVMVALEITIEEEQNKLKQIQGDSRPTLSKIKNKKKTQDSSSLDSN